MFCNHCGKPVEDGRILCEQCEAASGQNEQEHIEVVESSAEALALNPSDSQKSEKKIKSLIIGAAVAIVIALAVLVLLFWEPISGLFGGKLKFDTPQEHFSYVESEALDALADDLTSAYGQAISGYKKGEAACEAEVHLLLGKDALSLLSAYLGTNPEDELSWLSDIMLSMDVSGNSDTGQATLALGLGATEVISTDMIIDSAEHMLWAAIPELSSTYLEMDLNSLMGDSAVSFDYDPVRYSELAAEMPSEQVVNEILNRYSDIILGQITNVESQPQTVTVNGISQEYTVLTATVDEKNLIEIAIAVLEEAKDDDVLMDMLGNVAKCAEAVDAGEAEEALLDAIDNSLEDLHDSLEIASPDNYIQLIDYVDKKHNIVGRRILITGFEEDIYFLTVKSENEFAFEAAFTESIFVTGKGTENLGILSAEYVLNIEGMEYLTIEAEELNVRKLESGNISGTIRLIPSDDIVEEALGIGLDFALELILDTSDSESHAELNLLMEEEMFIGIVLEAEQTDTTQVKIPTNTIDPANEDQLIEWLRDFDYEAIINNLGKAGLPNDHLDAVEELLESVEENMSNYD